MRNSTLGVNPLRSCGPSPENQKARANVVANHSLQGPFHRENTHIIRLLPFVLLLFTACLLPGLARAATFQETQEQNLVTQPGQRLDLQLPSQNCTIVVTPGNELHIRTSIWGNAKDAAQKQQLLKEASVSIIQSGQVISIRSSADREDKNFVQNFTNAPQFFHRLWAWLFHGDPWIPLPSLHHSQVQAKLQIALPEYLPIVAKLGTGEFLFHNPKARNPLTVKDGTGQIQIDSSTPEMTLDAGTGKVLASQHSGQRTNIQSGTGTVYWQGSTQHFEIHTGTGNIQIHALAVSPGDSFSAHTGTGNIALCFAGKPALSGLAVTATGGFDAEHPFAPSAVDGRRYQFGPVANSINIQLHSGTGSIRLRKCPS
ncbi:hypothetical protein B1757_04050 [Acidithiobacillus marinus]|uniref:Adhesin domain-containing protein n=2 Tax=Acidithiobacillus marinus TaxID=187490 RepID=A0A2I1DND7_9PROT|nr:hypothetical protein B1757_04050 [Acidithiobacillus marinus]